MSNSLVPVYSAEVKRRFHRLRQSLRTHLAQAHCRQGVKLTTGLPKIRQGGQLAGLTEHAVRGINNGRQWTRAMVGTYAEDAHRGEKRRDTLVGCWQDERFREGQTAALGCWLNGNEYILTTAESMREMDESDLVGMV